MPLIDPQLREAITSRRRSLCVFGSLILVSAATGVFVLWSIRPLPFSSALWQEQKHLRPRMVDDLLKSSVLKGLSQDETARLLGSPSSHQGQRFLYRTGTQPIIDDWWLEVEFNNGRVANVRHVPD